MSLLQYTSAEMFSSTELVRKSKNIFDKLNKKEIQKAIILRDGKPNTIILDFSMYEKIMADYLNLKGQFPTFEQKTVQLKREEKLQEKIETKLEEQKIQKVVPVKLTVDQILEEKIQNNSLKSLDDINEDEIINQTMVKDEIIDDEDFQAALDKIDNLDFNIDLNQAKKDKDETLKEFWNKD